MIPSDGNTSWFALFVKPNHERVTAALLRRQSFEEFVPLYRARRRWSDRIKEIDLPLFPCYVFCRFSGEVRNCVRRTPGVIRVIAFGGNPIPIPDDEIESMLKIVRSNLGAEPWPGVHAGQHVVIESGPLAGVRGAVVRLKKGHRLVVTVTLLNQSVAVEIDPAWARPVDRLEVRPAKPQFCAM